LIFNTNKPERPLIVVVVPVATFPVYAALVVMDKGQAPEVHLVRVTADDGTWRIWLAATARDVAVQHVLDVIPEGWTASLFENRLSKDDVTKLHMRVGEVREVPNGT
jgi:hypothetical protein